MWYVLGLAAGSVVVWYGIAMAWASSVAQHSPDLREGVGQVRYGWRCPRCGRVEAPACTVNKCGGPLVWVAKGTKIKCSRCYRNLVAHPMLFREAPRPRSLRCSQCGWSGKITNFKLD